MTTVAETSGQHGPIYERMAEYYDQSLTARRTFWGKMAWPAFQLGMALVVFGILIWVMGILPVNQGAGKEKFDILGWGLIGTPGLVIYVNTLLFIALVVELVYEAARRQMLWTRRMQSAFLRIPVLGPALKTLALSRFAWAMHLVLDTPMDVRVALPLALETAGNDHYARHSRTVARLIDEGLDIHAALAATGVFPTDMLDAMAVGEQSGRLVESMERLSRDYRQRATAAISLLAQLAGYAVWLMVAVFLIYMIFQIFSVYVGQIEQLL